jgi:hypothetical protein
MDKLVFVKELKTPNDKNGKPYCSLTDQNGQVFNFFKGEKFDLGKAYLFTFTLNDRGFPDVTETKSVVNIFQERALREVASKSDIIRGLSTSLSYAKDMLVGGVLEPDKMYDKAMEMHLWVQENADKLMPKLED